MNGTVVIVEVRTIMTGSTNRVITKVLLLSGNYERGNVVLLQGMVMGPLRIMSLNHTLSSTPVPFVDGNKTIYDP